MTDLLFNLLPLAVTLMPLFRYMLFVVFAFEFVVFAIGLIRRRFFDV